MQIQKSPYPTDFLLNNPEFVIRTSPDRVEERRIDRHFLVLKLVNGGTIKIETAHGVYNYTVKTDANPDREWEINEAGDDADRILEALEMKVVHNAKINRHYNVRAWTANGKVRMRITAKEGLTGDRVEITTEGDCRIDTLDLLGTRRGRTREPKTNYSIMAKYLLDDGTETPEMHLDDNNGTVKAGTEMLAAYIGKPDIPRIGEPFGAEECANAAMNARMLYAEVVNGETGLVKISKPVRLLNAKVTEADFLNNMPDWKTKSRRKMWMQEDLETHGQDDKDTVRTDPETEQYLYVSNLSAHDIQCQLTVEAYDYDMAGYVYENVITIRKGAIVRISCGWQAIRTLDGINVMEGIPARWTVSVKGDDGIITRSYTVRPRPYGAVTALLLNRCRLYESLVFEETAEETQREGETVETASSTAYLTRKRTDTVTLRTGKRTAKEIAMLRDALEQQDNLLLDRDGRHAWRITFAPDTLKLEDTGEDLLEAEVKAVRNERIDRKANQNPPEIPIREIEGISEMLTTIGK